MPNMVLKPTAPFQLAFDQRVVPIRTSYTGLTWEQLQQTTCDSRGTGLKKANYHSLEPPLAATFQYPARPESKAPQNTAPTDFLSTKINEEPPQSINDGYTAGKRQARHIEWQYPRSGTPGVPRRDQSKKDFAFKRSEQDNHQGFRLWNACEDKRVLEPNHLDQPIRDCAVEDISYEPPQLLYAMGERPVASLSIRHPARYILRSLPGREMVSTTTWRSRFPASSSPKTVDQVTQEDEAKSQPKPHWSKSCREETKARIKAAELGSCPIHSESTKETAAIHRPTGLTRAGDYVSNDFALSRACYPHPVPHPRPEMLTEEDVLIATLGRGLEQEAPQVISQAQKPSQERSLAELHVGNNRGGYSREHHLPMRPKIMRKGLTIQIQSSPVPSQHKALREELAGSVEANKCATENVVDRKRKASGEPQDGQLNKAQRYRRKKSARKRQATAEAANALINTIKKMENDKDIDVMEVRVIRQKCVDDVNWQLLDEEDQERLLAVGVQRPRKPFEAVRKPQKLPNDQPSTKMHGSLPNTETPLETFEERSTKQKKDVGEAKERLDKRPTDVKCISSLIFMPLPTSPDENMSMEQTESDLSGSKPRGARRLKENEMEEKKLGSETKLSSEVSAILEGYRRQRMDRRDVEDLIEQGFAETEEEYIKVEGKDGEPEYVVWKDLLKMELELEV